MSVIVIAEQSSLTPRLRGLGVSDVLGLRPTFTEHVIASMISGLGRLDLVVIGEEVTDLHAQELADVVLDHAPNVPVVLVRDGRDSLSEDERDIGIREVIEASSSDLVLGRMLNRYVSDGDPAQSTPPPEEEPDQGGRVVVVMSPKGGVGKTTFAINYAVALSDRAPSETVIVDYDAQFGDVSSMLNVAARHSVDEAFTTDGVQPSAELERLTVPFAGRLAVLSGSDSPEAMAKVTAAQAAQLLRELSGAYPYVVVDTGSGLTDETLAALEVATDVIMITTMDVSAVKALHRAVELLQRLDLLPERRSLVVNMTDDGTGLTTGDIGLALRMPVSTSIPRSTAVALSVNVGKPMAQTHADSDFMRAVDLLVEQVVAGRPTPSRRRDRSL